MNALAEYGTSSSETEDESDPERLNEPSKASAGAKLPKPEFGSSQPIVNNSVFTNPFVQEELAKSAILEKHVKMVPVKDQTHMINGKRICWNYRKGRCRFGHNCKYAHDSDIQKTPEEIEAEKQGCNTVVCEASGPQCLPPPPASDVRESSDDRWDGDENRPKLKMCSPQGRNTVVCEASGPQCVPPPPASDVRESSDDRWDGDENRPKLKRPGLSQGIVPGKKVMKMYHKQKTNSFKK